MRRLGSKNGGNSIGLAVGLFLTVLAAPPAPAWAASCLAQLQTQSSDHAATGRVIRVIDGDTVELDTGPEVRMIGTQAPKLPLGRRDFKAWPMSTEAKTTLEAMVLGKNVQLHFGPADTDRYGRALAHVVTIGTPEKESLWAQGEMIARGMARVYVLSDNRVCVSTLLEKEQNARKIRAGIWSHRFYDIRPHDRSQEDVGTFQIVEGVVLDVAQKRKRFFLNFGEDWREDFTVTVSPQNAKVFEEEVDLFSLKGKTIRVRGWVEDYNGPFIEAVHPDQIEETAEKASFWPF